MTKRGTRHLAVRHDGESPWLRPPGVAGRAPESGCGGVPQRDPGEGWRAMSYPRIDRVIERPPNWLDRIWSGLLRRPPSTMYRGAEHLEPTHEWYKPSIKWARRKGPAMLDHVRRGGLVLREIEVRET